MLKLPIADCRLLIVVASCFAVTALAQESAALAAMETPSATATPSASPVAARNVPLRFVPPPMEGTISLGIWDSNDKLVRILHREAKIDNFEVEENSLSTKWDGKNDAGEDLPPGRYRARGYTVAKMKVEDLGKVAAAPETATDRVSVKLVINPLTSDTRVVMEIAAGFDNQGSFLKTTDGLPLATINQNPNLSRVILEKNGDKAAEVWQEDASGIAHLRVSNIDKMIAFDCGFFELK